MNREQQFMQFFTNLTQNNLHKDIENIFAEDARFKDPFNDVVGIESIKTIFNHMFSITLNPKFVINHSASNNELLFLEWDFTFTKNSQKWLIVGSSMITFNENNLVQSHIDYWDPAEQIYSKIGLLKPIMKFLKSRLSAT